MVKLKTLRALCESEKTDFGFECNFPLSIRYAAMQWIKYDEKKYISLGNIIPLVKCNKKHRCEKCQWIMHFFNISEKDLEMICDNTYNK